MASLIKKETEMNAISQTTSAADACCSSCAAGAVRDDSPLAVACTLGATDFEDRVKAIRDLAGRALLRSERDGLTLRLTYRAHALSEVEAVVAQESECCAFLTFDLEAGGDTVKLTVTTPAFAVLAANELFDHFAPELAQVAA